MLKKLAKYNYALLIFIISIHILLLNKTVFWPSTEFRVFPYLTSVGLIPYKEIIDQHFPGLFFFPINLYSLGLANMVGLKITQLLIVIFMQILIYATTYKITRSAYLSLIANIAYLFSQIMFEGYVLWIDNILALPLLMSFYLIVPSKKMSEKTSVFLSGLFLGLGLLLKQTVAIIFIFIIAYLIVKKTRLIKIVFYLAGFLVPVATLIYYISNLHVWHDFLYWTIIFNYKIYPKFAFRLPTLTEVVKISAVVIPSLISTTYLLYINFKRNTVLLLGIFLSASLIFIYGRYDFVHLQPFLPYYSIILAIAFVKAKRFPEILMPVLFVLIIAFAGITHIDSLNNFYHPTVVKNITSKQDTILKLTKDNKVYAYGVFPEYYQLSNTIPPGRFFAYNHPWYMSILENRVINSLNKSKPDMVIISTLDTIRTEKSLVDSYIKNNYLKKASIGNIDMLTIKSNSK